MANIARITSTFVEGMLRSETGLPQSVAALSVESSFVVPDPNALSIVTRNVAPELTEKSAGSRYPVFHIYCDRITNSLREKFRKFSGGADMAIEIRVSHDHLEEVERQLNLYIDAVTDVLDRNRGDWGSGMFYTGGYEVSLAPMKTGGRHFLQSAKIKFNVLISSD